VRFVKVTHPVVGEALVAEISVPNMLPNGWTLVDDVEPPRASPVTVHDLSQFVGGPLATDSEPDDELDIETPTDATPQGSHDTKES
jgi:hypothetical protein